MNFLNPLPFFLWFIPLIPLLIFLINRRKHNLVEFSSIRFLMNLKKREINKLRLINIILLIIRTLILIIILLIIMRPEIENINIPSDISDSKISNIILIDDSFSNQYGKIYGEDRKIIIENIIKNICDVYPVESNLKIAYLNQGPAFNGYNDQNFNYLSFNSVKNFTFLELANFLNEEDDFEFKNLHIISNSNKSSIIKNKEIYSNIKNKNNLNIFYHYLPESSNNQYISNVHLINSENGLFHYEIEFGNDDLENIDLILSVKQNLYNYNDSKFSINQTTPLLNKNITINSKSSIIDTISIELKPDYFMELKFDLKIKQNNLIVDLVDDRVEDNTYSYIMNLPKEINISVFYNKKDNIKYIKPALETFQLVTKRIDSSFLKINYVYSEGINKYSNYIKNQDILMFLGYNIFLKSDKYILNNFFSDNSQIIVFPIKNDIENKDYFFSINDSLTIQNSYKKNQLNNYDKVDFSENKYVSNSTFYDNNFKLNDYFFHNLSKNSILQINNDKSIWSRYNIGNGHLDLFGFFIDDSNNFFDSEITYSLPLLYSIIIDEKINSINNNLLINQSNDIFNKNFDKIKLVNTNNDSINFYDSQSPIIRFKSLNGLIAHEQLIDLYSFNASKENFNNNTNLDKVNSDWNFKLITYSDTSFESKFSNILYKNEITIYLIYFLICLLLIEIYLSNAKPSKSY